MTYSNDYKEDRAYSRYRADGLINDDKFKAWYIKRFYQLGLDRVKRIAAGIKSQLPKERWAFAFSSAIRRTYRLKSGVVGHAEAAKDRPADYELYHPPADHSKPPKGYRFAGG